MAEKSDMVRRWLGAFFLLSALVMLVAGETALNERLRSHPWEFVIFWLACFAFVGLALLMAMLDMAAVRRRVRREERELLESTMRQITEAKALKENKPPQNSVD